MKTLDPKSKAATMLLRISINMGYSAGPEFPGATIRNGINKLYSLCYLEDDENNRMVITKNGQQYLNENHLQITM
jgi:hypothetical protein